MDDLSVGVYDANDSGRIFAPKLGGDIGHDLHATINHRNIFDHILSWFMAKKVIILWPMVGQRTIGSMIALVMPPDVWCEIRPRSSTSQKRLGVLAGTIDSGYMGELFTVIHNYGILPRIIVEGERYAQVIFYNAVRPHIVHLTPWEYDTHMNQSMIDGHRGGSGFGSTGQ